MEGLAGLNHRLNLHYTHAPLFAFLNAHITCMTETVFGVLELIALSHNDGSDDPVLLRMLTGAFAAYIHKVLL